MEEEQNQNDMSKKDENNDAVLDADIESKKDEKISYRVILNDFKLKIKSPGKEEIRERLNKLSKTSSPVLAT